MGKLNTNKTLESTAATGTSNAPTWFSIWTAASGGSLLAYGQITNPPGSIASGDKVTIANAVTIVTMNPATRQQELLIRRFLEGYTSGGPSSITNDMYVQAHTDDPGTNGTDNVITVVGRIAVDVSADLVYSAT